MTASVPNTLNVAASMVPRVRGVDSATTGLPAVGQADGPGVLAPPNEREAPCAHAWEAYNAWARHPAMAVPMASAGPVKLR